MWRDFWPSIRHLSRGAWTIIIVLIVLLGAGTAGAWQIWASLGGTAISTHGLIALGLGAVFTLLLGGGLMALAFYSARHGHDDIEGRDDR